MSERIPTLLYLLARELGECCKLPTQHSDASHHGLATKCDLALMEARILAAIGSGISDADKAALDAALVKLATVVEKFEQLDSTNSA